MPDAVEVEHTSGCTRLCNSFITAFCLGPALILGCCFVLGWNERRAVCDDKAIAEGKEKVVKVGCDSSMEGHGDLVLFSCDLQEGGLDPLTAEGDFQGLIPANNTQYVGIEVIAEMLQCVEHVQTVTKKDNVGGGTTTERRFTYSTEWRSSHVDSRSFRTDTSSWRSECGAQNPAWDSRFPTTGKTFVPEAKVGAFTVHQGFLQGISLNEPLIAASTPDDWQESGGTYTWTSPIPSGIGNVRVNFWGNDWSRPEMTVLGENARGNIGHWTASDSWMCSGFTLGRLKEGFHTIDQFFAALTAEATSITVLFRVLGVVIMWIGFGLLFKPLEVAADCIPFVGPYLGNGVSFVTGCITCPMAFCCGLGIIGAMWVFMRPLVGGPLLVLWCCGCAVGTGLFYKWEQDKKKKEASGPPPEEAAAAAC